MNFVKADKGGGERFDGRLKKDLKLKDKRIMIKSIARKPKTILNFISLYFFGMKRKIFLYA